jgi:hypothetical protein
MQILQSSTDEKTRQFNEREQELNNRKYSLDRREEILKTNEVHYASRLASLNLEKKQFDFDKKNLNNFEQSLNKI